MLHAPPAQLRRHVPAEVMAQAEREAAAATPPPSSPLPGQGERARALASFPNRKCHVLVCIAQPACLVVQETAVLL